MRNALARGLLHPIDAVGEPHAVALGPHEWFFETFLLKADAAYRPFDEHYEVLFNSYYNSVGEQFPRARPGSCRGHRWPTCSRIVAMSTTRWAAGSQAAGWKTTPNLANVVEWGIHHEQQHQELILTDVKHMLSLNPLQPAYRRGRRLEQVEAAPLEWIEFDEGLYEIGHAGEGFAYDNEQPRHRTFLESFRLAHRPVTNGEFLAFIDDRATGAPELWLSEGWQTAQDQRWRQPLYWFGRGDERREFTLAGPWKLDAAAPASHLSYYEADAFARWAGARLPTEAEWEVAAQSIVDHPSTVTGRFVDTLLADGSAIHPQPAAVAVGTDHRRCSATCGNGPPAPTRPTRATSPQAALWASTTANSCATSTCCAAALAPRPRVTSERHIATSSLRTHWQFTGVRLAK